MSPGREDIGALEPPPSDLPQRRLVLREHPGPMVRIQSLRHTRLRFGSAAYYRFDAPKGEFGTLYVADDLAGALVETREPREENHGPVISFEWLRKKGLATVRFQRTLRLADVTDAAGLLAIGADNRLTTGPRRAAQLWGRALWQHPAHIDGIYCFARRGPRYAVAVLFDDRCEADIALDGVQPLLQHPQLRAVLNELGVRLVP